MIVYDGYSKFVVFFDELVYYFIGNFLYVEILICGYWW